MIQAKVIADSKTPTGERLTTLEVIMPRYILAEFNTHRMLSKNSASSRAIPFNKMVKNVKENPFIPYAWQKDHSGMQGIEYITDISKLENLNTSWINGREDAIACATHLNRTGLTKQLANRLLEPFMYHKVLVSSTEWENFFNLRCPQYQIQNSNEPIFKSWKELTNYYEDKNHDFWTGLHLEEFTTLERLQKNKGQADIHMMFLAEAIYDAMNESTPKGLKENEWHIPYGDNIDSNELKYLDTKYNTRTYELYYQELEDIRCKISIARCARLSYQTLGDNPVIDYEKDLQLYEVLCTSGHWSPFEHVAKIMTNDEYERNVKGKSNLRSNIGGIELVENVDIKGWCRNYKGFIQYRELLDN